MGYVNFDYDKSEDENKGKNYIIQSNKNVIRNIESNVIYFKLIIYCYI